MTKNRDRIQTTHVGSLPRPQNVVDMLFAQDNDKLENQTAFDSTMQAAVADIVAKQKAAGVDIVSDGEMSKISYATYIRHRLTGFEIGDAPRATPKDLDDYPGYRERLAQAGGTPKYHRPICRGPIAIKDLAPLQADIAHLKTAMAQSQVEHGFMNAASPGVVAVFQPNEYYKTQEAYIEALAEVMKVEYETIYEAGLFLQIDCPDLAMGRHIRFRDDDDATFLKNANLQVEALNYALENVPAEAIRMHLCWGNYEGPHHHDVPLETIMPTVMKAKPATILFEAANPRHAHEWAVWGQADIPDHKILAPGVLDTTCNYIEHPQLIAERLLRFTNIVGRERVIAGSDCGFGTFAGFGAIHPEICFAKLEAMKQGADIASSQLW